MGRGCDYRGSYPHLMLFDTFFLHEDDGEWDQLAYVDFKREVCDALGADYHEPVWKKNDTHYFGDHDHFRVGWDSTGDCPCIFVEPKTYEDGETLVPYVIEERVRGGFNTLIADHGEDFFRYPTSSYTAVPLASYPP